MKDTLTQICKEKFKFTKFHKHFYKKAGSTSNLSYNMNCLLTKCIFWIFVGIFVACYSSCNALSTSNEKTESKVKTQSELT